jgi:hypothetical protein
MDITEFEYLDPEAFHLVPEGATGFPVLLAKAAEALNDVMRAEPPHKATAAPKRKAPKKVNRKKLIKQLTESQAQLAAAGLSTPAKSSRVPMTLGQALRKLRFAAESAEAEGDVAKARGIRHDVAVAGIGASLTSPAATNRRLLGAGVPLFVNRHALPDDPEVRYSE